MLSQQLRNIANRARGIADQQQQLGQAQVGMQMAQAVAAQQPGKPTTQSAQQLAAAGTQAQQQAQLVPQQQMQQQVMGAAQQAVQAQSFGQQQMLAKTQQLNSTQIAEAQRAGAMRQNSEELRQAKSLSKAELDMQRRMSTKSLEYDNSISFLTRKQREDLANLDAYMRQQIFDNRLAFKYTEAGRQFSNMRQLADYAVAQAQDQETLRTQMREMQQAAEKELMVLEHAHKLLTDKLQLEFKRAEAQKDHALMAQLAEYKNAMEKKMRRKRAQASATSNIIMGAATIGGAVIGTFVAPGVGTAVGASIGAGVGQTVAGGAQYSGAY